MKDKSIVDVIDLCGPIAGTESPNSSSTGVWPLSRRGLGYTGCKTQTLACILVKETNQFGGFQGETIYPVATSVQQDDRIRQDIRVVAFYSTVTAAGETGLVYHKPPIPGLPLNTWLASAKQAVHASIECWGHFTSDHITKAYQFIEADDQLPDPEKLPSPKKLIQEILGDRVITSMDHPVIQQLLGTSNSPSTSNTEGWEDDGVY